MTLERMIELLNIEHECMLRNSHGDCDRKCEDCDLVQDDGELHEMYMDCIGLMKKQEPKTVLSDRHVHGVLEGYCPNCHQVVEWMINRQYCGFCGQAVKWE